MNEVVLNSLLGASLHPVIYFAILIIFLAIGDVISTLSKAYIPSLFVFAVLLLIGVWTNIIPQEIVKLAGFSDAFISVVIVMIVVNMGSSLSINDLKVQWKTVVIGLGGLVGVALSVLLIGAPIFGWDMAVIATPVVGGGLVAAFEMQAAALQKGLDYMAMVAILILTLQNFPAFLVVPTLLKRVARKELVKRNKAENSQVKKIEEQTKKKLFPALPERYNTVSAILAKIAFVSVLAVLSSSLTKVVLNPYDISPTIFALFYGVVGVEIGILPKNGLDQAKTSGLFLIASFVGIMGTLATADKNEVVQTIVPVFGLIFIAMIGIALISIIVGKLLKIDWELSFAIGLNCLLGFPVNYLLTIESIKAVTDDEEEYEYLLEKIAPIMLVAGFTTITIGSVIMAGIMKNFL
ncbi:hypothetical protein KQI86_09405 [Clostridium sp. MSJ-11]|uniref:Uncharacterized protein n=1 Tax=Clostridium mobile TaxID=2841512 RepID=A0ABS6EH52_9CLOT|nr:hypothetical protein [Clostridium mobile]MBU5484546.1 hypothetical protein [Clostridium mobile]